MRQISHALFLLLLLFCACPPSNLTPPITTRPPTPTPPAFSPYTLLALNLHCLKLDGTIFTTNDTRLSAIAREVAKNNTRVLLLQEVCVNDTENALLLLEDALETLTGAEWSAEFAFAHTAWEGTPDEASEGIAILVQGEPFDAETLVYRNPGALRRVALMARLPEDLGGFRVLSTHLDFNDADERAAQGRETASFGLRDGLDIVVGGDLNDPMSGAAHVGMEEQGYRNSDPLLEPERIDHVLAHRGANLTLSDTRLLFDGGATPLVSDHPGVLVTVEDGWGELVVETTVSALYSDGVRLSLRGDTEPLNWDRGLPMHTIFGGLWQLRLTELPPGDFEFKTLRYDQDWQTGENSQGATGQDNLVVPGF